MAYRYFRGRIDLGGLSLADLSKATEALAVLEQLAADGRIGFEMGVGRNRREPRQAGRPIQPQERAMLEAMPIGVVHFPGGISDNLADKALSRGIPIQRAVKAVG